MSLKTARPLTSLKAKDGQPNWDEVRNLLEEWLPKALVVGLPINNDGSDSEMSRRAKKFANRLHGRFGLPVETITEELSSFEAREYIQAGKGNQKKQHIDSIAAALILESWLNHNTD